MVRHNLDHRQSIGGDLLMTALLGAGPESESGPEELLTQILEKLDRIDALLTEFEPVLRAYLDPAASGPVAWAVRRKIKP